jgi:hypothetical protein
MSSSEINYLTQSINNIKENLIELSNRLSKLERNNKLSYSSNKSSNFNPDNRFLKRDEIIEFLLRLGTNQDEIFKTTNYKELLEKKLKSRNYKGSMTYSNVRNYFTENDIPIITAIDEVVKKQVLELVKQRKEDLDNKKKVNE